MKSCYRFTIEGCMLILLMVLFVFLLSYFIYINQGILQEEKVKCDSCMMYNMNVTRGICGLYYDKEKYCVWTDGACYAQQNFTKHHETCHALIQEGNYNHFCQ